MYISQLTLCLIAAPLTCEAGFIPCPGGRRVCIRPQWLCDGTDNCYDNSDEDPQYCGQ